MDKFLEEVFNYRVPRIVSEFKPRITNGKLECVILLEKQGYESIRGWAKGMDVDDCIRDIQSRLADNSYTGRMVTRAMKAGTDYWYE